MEEVVLGFTTSDDGLPKVHYLQGLRPICTDLEMTAHDNFVGTDNDVTCEACKEMKK